MSLFSFIRRLCPCFRRWRACRQPKEGGASPSSAVAYKRVAGVRHVVVLNPYQGYDPPHFKLVSRIKDGLEVKANTWGELEEQVCAWLEWTEQSVFPNRVLLIDEAASAGDADGGERWKLYGMWGHEKEHIPTEYSTQCFAMRRRVPRQSLYFILLTDVA
jgi:hypothetical protein